MFEGEMASLTAILQTDTVKVPKPIKVLDGPGGSSMLVMEHLDMRYLSRYVLAPSLLVGFGFLLSGSSIPGACTRGITLWDVIPGTHHPHTASTLQAKGNWKGISPGEMLRGLGCKLR